MSKNTDRLVYSTETGSHCPKCDYPLKKCRCPDTNEQAKSGSGGKKEGWVRLRQETKGRKGKGVTLIDNLSLSEKELKALTKKLKQLCGTGGALKDCVIEIQGDKRDAVEAELIKQGYKVKRSGG
ncbi:MAG: hypothetical protein COB04_04845 [Gammaproteobacteria bacterium]|nr:MAG: hypothetical protein COB04_04845 [Gammaproteobacteria bacterium]